MAHRMLPVPIANCVHRTQQALTFARCNWRIKQATLHPLAAPCGDQVTGGEAEQADARVTTPSRIEQFACSAKQHLVHMRCRDRLLTRKRGEVWQTQFEANDLAAHALLSQAATDLIGKLSEHRARRLARCEVA